MRKEKVNQNKAAGCKFMIPFRKTREKKNHEAFDVCNFECWIYGNNK